MLEGGEGDYDNPDGDDGARLVKKPYCKLTNHNWEHCNNSEYVKTGSEVVRNARSSSNTQDGSTNKKRLGM
jgi:hypothetical protein